MDISQVTNAQEAISFLQSNQNVTKSQLDQLVNQMSISLNNAESLLLYSGNLDQSGTGLQSWKAAEFMGAQSGGQIGTIGQTDAYKLVNSVEFENAIENAIGAQQASEYFSGITDVNGVRTQLSIWDNLSIDFVTTNANGIPVKTLTATSQTFGNFAQAEIDALMFSGASSTQSPTTI